MKSTVRGLANTVRSKKAQHLLAHAENIVRQRAMQRVGLMPFIVVDLFSGCGGASQGLLRALDLAGLTPERLREYGYYLRLININHWEIAISTLRNNIGMAELYNATIENWAPGRILDGVRPHLLIAAPECIMYSKARGNKDIRDQSRTTAAWVEDWVKTRPHTLYFENVEEWTTWSRLDENMKPVKGYEGEYFDAFVANIKALGYDNFKYGVFTCADYGDPTTRRRLFCTAWHNEYQLPPSVPSPTHTQYPERYPWLEEWVPIRECLDFSRPSPFITARTEEGGYPIHAPATIRRIKTGFTSQRAWDSPLYETICNRLEPIAQRAHDTLKARPSEAALKRKLTADEKRENKRVLEAVRNDVREAIREAASEPLAHFEEGEIPSEIKLALAAIIGQHAGSGPRTEAEPIMTLTSGGGTGISQPFLAKANASEKSAFANDATQSVDVPKRTIVTKECSALAEPTLLIVRHGADDIRIPDKDRPIGTLTTKNELGIAQVEVSLSEPSIIHQYSSNITGTGTNNGASSPVSEPCSTISAGGNHHGLTEGFIGRCFGDKGENGRTHSFDEPARTIGAEGNQNSLTQGFITKNYGERHDGENRTTVLGEPIDAIPATVKHGLAQASILSNHFENASQSINAPAGTATTATGGGFGLIQPAEMLSQGDGGSALPTHSPVMFYFTIGTTRYYINIRYRMLHSSELAKAHSLGHVQFAGSEQDAIRQIGNSIPARTAAAFIGHLLKPVFARLELPVRKAA